MLPGNFINVGRGFSNIFRLPTSHIHFELLDLIKRERMHDKLLKPYYGKYSISEVVPTILSLFGIDPKRPVLPFPIDNLGEGNKVVLMIIDGLSFHHFAKYQQRFKLFDLLTMRGEVYPITSVFPSTTPAALTTLHSGLSPQEHGLPEWSVYFEEFDSIIETLPFKRHDVSDMDSLIREGGSYEMLYEGPTIYSQLKENGVRSFTFTSSAYSTSTYSKTVHFGSETIPCVSGEDFIDKAAINIEEAQTPSYFVMYWGMVDSAAHIYGPESKEHLNAIQYISDLMENFFKKLRKNSENIIFLLTADHGQVNIRGEDIINLNKYQIIEDNFQVNKRGMRILPTGSPHDVFLFIRPERVNDVTEFLQDELYKRAYVFPINEALEQGFFGVNNPKARFLRRIGNILIIPKSGFHVWYEFLPNAPFRQLGVHGGMSEDEMTVPFAFARLSSLV